MSFFLDLSGDFSVVPNDHREEIYHCFSYALVHWNVNQHKPHGTQGFQLHNGEDAFFVSLRFTDLVTAFLKCGRVFFVFPHPTYHHHHHQHPHQHGHHQHLESNLKHWVHCYKRIPGGNPVSPESEISLLQTIKLPQVEKIFPKVK